jgi:integrase
MRTTKDRGDAVATGRPKWLGGFIRQTKRGKPVYVIEKRIRGALFKVSTRKHTEDAAMRELRRFEADPAGYDPVGLLDRLVMTPELIMEYRAWQLEPPPVGRGNTYEWAQLSARHLFDWLERLAGIDLRRVSLIEHVKPALREWRSPHQRATALKGFFTWLRKERGLLKHHEDPMPDLRIPQLQAAKNSVTGARDVPFDKVQRVYRHLRSDVVDVLDVLSATGWHVSEVMRFATNGEIRKDPTGKGLATLVTWHKRREHAVAGIHHPEHLEAAKRIRERGFVWGRSTLTRLMREANIAAGIDPQRERPVRFGDMRHNVSTWAIEDGDDVANVAKAFNHTDEKMLRQHYVRHAVPRGTVSTRVLRR